MEEDEENTYLQFHIHVIEAKHLKSRDESKSSDPFVSVYVFDTVQHTSIIYDSLNCTWDKTFFFEFNVISKKDLHYGKISFIVYDSNTWKRNTIIGTYDMDIVYLLENKVYKQWVVLSDPTNTYKGTQGFLNVSVSVIKEGNKIEYENRLDECNDLLLPINVEKEEYVFVCCLHCIDSQEEGLFVCLEFGNGIECKSSIIFHTNPVYNQELQLPIIFPTMSDIVKITVLKKSGIIETCICKEYIYISKTSKRRERLPQWYHMYNEDKYELSMLCHFYLQKTENPQLNVFDIVPLENGIQYVKVKSEEKQHHNMIVPRPPTQNCVISCNLYECHNIQSFQFSTSQYIVEIHYKKQVISSSSKTITHSRLVWNEKLNASFLIEKAISNQDMLNVFLKKDDKIIGKTQITLTNICEIKKPCWYKIGKSHVLMSFILYRKSQYPKIDHFIESQIKKYHIVYKVFDGLFDTYGNYSLQFHIHNECVKTNIIKEKSLCNWFGEYTKIVEMFVDVSIMPLLHVDLLDENKVIDECFLNIQDFEKTKKLVFTKSKGVVNIDFCLYDSKSDIIEKPIKHIHDTYICRIVVFGLRHFQSHYLTQKIKLSIFVNDEKQYTQTVSSSSNINVLEIFDFIVNQYAQKQYIVIDIEDTTLFHKKIGECRFALENHSLSSHDEDEDNVFHDRDDIPSYLQHKRLLNGALEDYYETPQPFKNWKIKNKHSKTIGYTSGYTRIFKKNNVQNQVISHQNESVVFENEKVTIRIYILRCLNLIAKDITGSSDPYVVLKIGKYEKKTKIIKQNLCPEFHEMIEFQNIKVPCDGFLHISVYDWDFGKNDDLIGETFIDIPNRWFHDEWNNMQNKPLELRTLYHNHASGPQGMIELWVDIFTKHQAKIFKPIDISLPPLKPFVVRLIIWNAKKLSCNDMNNMNDVYISGILNDEKKCTDIHWRASHKRAHFNYRLLWNVNLPMKKLYSKLTIQAWDQDIIGESDLIGEGVLDLHTLFKNAYTTLLPQRYSFTNEKDVWVELFHSDFPNISRGYVRISLEVVSQFYANQHPAGEGRNAPNVNPTLQEPIRPSFQINRPLELLADILGEEYYKKLKCIVFIFCSCSPFLFIMWLWVQIKHAFGIKYSWE